VLERHLEDAFTVRDRAAAARVADDVLIEEVEVTARYDADAVRAARNAANYADFWR